MLYACKVANLENFNLPYPNYYTLGANIKFFAANGARGYYAEGVGYGSGGDLSELKDYLMSSLLWNSSVDPDQVVEEFLDDYCKKHPQFPMSLVISFLMYMQHAHRDLRPFSDGIAAPFVRKYMDTLHGSVADTDYFMTLSFDSTAPFLTPITVLTAARALRDGQALLSGEQASRLGGNTLPIYWVVMQRWMQLRQFAEAEEMAWPLEPTLEAAFEHFSIAFNFTKERFGRAPSLSGERNDTLAWARDSLFGSTTCLGGSSAVAQRVVPLAVTTQGNHYFQDKPTLFGAWESGRLDGADHLFTAVRHKYTTSPPPTAQPFSDFPAFSPSPPP